MCVCFPLHATVGYAFLPSSIPPVQQRLRSGFPPKELLPECDDPSLPVNLTNGERVSVDIIASADSSVAMDTSNIGEVSKPEAEGGKEVLHNFIMSCYGCYVRTNCRSGEHSSWG